MIPASLFRVAEISPFRAWNARLLEMVMELKSLPSRYDLTV